MLYFLDEQKRIKLINLKEKLKDNFAKSTIVNNNKELPSKNLIKIRKVKLPFEKRIKSETNPEYSAQFCFIKDNKPFERPRRKLKQKSKNKISEYLSQSVILPINVEAHLKH